MSIPNFSQNHSLVNIILAHPSSKSRYESYNNSLYTEVVYRFNTTVKSILNLN